MIIWVEYLFVIDLVMSSLHRSHTSLTHFYLNIYLLPVEFPRSTIEETLSWAFIVILLGMDERVLLIT